MMKASFRQVIRGCTGLAWFLAIAIPANAQEVAPTFDQLPSVVKWGETVHVTDAAGRQIKGKLKSFSWSSLELLNGETLAERDITRIRVERNDPVWQGALIGLGAVGLPWLIICASDDAWCEYGEYGAENLYRGMAIVTTAIGAGVGALIDRAITEKVTVYRAPRSGALSMRVAPVLAPSMAGIHIRARF